MPAEKNQNRNISDEELVIAENEDISDRLLENEDIEDISDRLLENEDIEDISDRLLENEDIEDISDRLLENEDIEDISDRLLENEDIEDISDILLEKLRQNSFCRDRISSFFRTIHGVSVLDCKGDSKHESCSDFSHKISYTIFYSTFQSCYIINSIYLESLEKERLFFFVRSLDSSTQLLCICQ